MLPLQQQNKKLVGHAAMQRLFDTAPYLARCSDNKTAALIRPRDYAVRFPYMQINRPTLMSWLIFDLDHANPNAWEDGNLPAPNFIVRDKIKNTSHLFYAIVPVCISDKGRSKPIQFMKRIYSAMATSLNADESYAGIVAKTPHHPMWSTTELHDYVYELSELAGHVELEYTPPWAKKEAEDMSHSRNCTLFEELRLFAYSIVEHARENSHYEAFKSRLERYAEQQNNFSTRGGFESDLSYSEVRATVKSVARWTWDKYTGGECANRGIMKLPSSLTIEERQGLAARRTHGERKSSTAKKVLLAVQQLIKNQKKVTQLAIAELAKLSRQTVAKYKGMIKAIVARPNIISLEALLAPLQNVNYAVSDICPAKDLPEHPRSFQSNLSGAVIPFSLRSKTTPQKE
ncbi:replication initiation protein [Vibrio harveyi]|uniref:replication initiation protein n=1 Tax=Vibrio harveyi TaxID=669 RepID=UPI003BB5B498